MASRLYLLQLNEIISIVRKVLPKDPGIGGLVARNLVAIKQRREARNIEGEGCEGAAGRKRSRGQRRKAEGHRSLHDDGDGGM